MAGQFTTTGDLSGQLYTQVFINGDGQNEVQGADGAPVVLLSVNGCTDATACNYDAAADSDGTCEYPIDLYQDYYDCAGNCVNDADGDGVCDEEETTGADVGARNYNANATDDDGSCEYTELRGLYGRRRLQLRHGRDHRRWEL